MQSMREIAQIIQQFDAELRQHLPYGRAGVFRLSTGELEVRANLPLGQGYKDEMLGVFADEADLDFFYKTYLNT